MIDAEKIKNFLNGFEIRGRVAVAVSGGPDSMALAYALVHWTDLDVHILSVDHGLRSEAADEIELVRGEARQWGASFEALKWEHQGVSDRIQEQARRARYDLMSQYCRAQDIPYLFLGHHMDDQAETFLFRLAKGSGLDGLCGMRAMQEYDEHLTLVRPLLDAPKAALIELCDKYAVPYVKDPSNDKKEYVRGRLRAARDVLEGEGLTAKRLYVSAARINRAREALEIVTGKVYVKVTIEQDDERLILDLEGLKAQPDEIVIRVLIKAMLSLGPKRDYLPRYEKIEDVCFDMIDEAGFRKRTLGGVVFERDDKQGRIILEKEKRA